jgi:hypothetical protein
MRILAILAAAIMVGVGVGLVAAHSPSSNASCNSVQDETNKEVLRLPLLGLVVLTIPLDVHVGASTIGPVTVGPIDLGGTYYVTKGLSVFRESNGAAGLQTHAHTCRPDTSHHNFETVTIPADDETIATVAVTGVVIEL